MIICFIFYICLDKGLFLFFVSEVIWLIGVWVIIYFIGFFWSFMVIVIIVDIFMFVIV